MYISKFVKWFLIATALVVLTACGGVGEDPGDDYTGPVQNTEPSTFIELNQNVVLIQDDEAKTVLPAGTASDENTKLTVSKDLAASLKSEDIFVLPSGVNQHFPLGASGKIESINGTEIVLSPVQYADIVSRSKLEDSTTQFTAENFVGIIGASFLESSATQKQQKAYKSNPDIQSYFNGGVVFDSSDKSKQEKSFLGEDGSVDLVDIKLSVNLNLEKIANVEFLSDTNSEAKLSFSNALTNLELKESHDLSLKGDKSFSMNINGEMRSELKLKGEMKATFAYSSKVWEEVASSTYSRLGVNAKLSGLSSEDKVGKYPLIGLVFVSPIPLKIKDVEKGASLAKLGGAIVWLYINAKGELTLEGSTGVEAQAPFNVGMYKSVNGGLEFINHINTENGINPVITTLEGKLSQTATVGVSLEVDTFLLGVRIANAAIDANVKESVTITAYGPAIYTEEPSELIDGVPYDTGYHWVESRICVNGNIGAGVVASANLKMGIDIDAMLFDYQADLGYSIQVPTEEDMAEIGGTSFWVQQVFIDQCFNTPEAIGSMNNHGTIVNFNYLLMSEANNMIRLYVSRSHTDPELITTDSLEFYLPFSSISSFENAFTGDTLDITKGELAHVVGDETRFVTGGVSNLVEYPFDTYIEPNDHHTDLAWTTVLSLSDDFVLHITKNPDDTYKIDSTGEIQYTNMESTEVLNYYWDGNITEVPNLYWDDNNTNNINVINWGYNGTDENNITTLYYESERHMSISNLSITNMVIEKDMSAE